MILHRQPPAHPGMSIADVDTPSLLLDLDAFERNLRQLPASLPSNRTRVRPHAKSHKCPQIALRQISAGAAGICCQKVSEAEAMAEGGVRDIHVANEIVGESKLAALAQLARDVRISVCADDARNVERLEAAAARADVSLSVFVELDLGTQRCGVTPGEPLLTLARKIAASPHLRFAGLQAYFGSAQHRRTVEERRSAAASTAQTANSARALLAAHGIACPLITGGGTGTYLFDVESGGLDEVQPGSYVLMDADYARNETTGGLRPFEQSLFVWTTLMSRPAPGFGAVDAGLKALSIDSGMPLVCGNPGVDYVRAADEHGVLRFTDPGCPLAVGDKIKLIPGHCDPTVNLHDWFVCCRNDRVEALWPITARGAIR